MVMSRVAAAAEANHFVDFNKMVLIRPFCGIGGNFRPADGDFEITPFCISKEFLDLPGIPELDAHLVIKVGQVV